MNKVFISVIVVFAVLGGLVIFQATKQTASAVLLPSELLIEQSKSKLARVRVGGRVADPIDYKVQPEIELKFSVSDPPDKNGAAVSDAKIPVIYTSLKPDMFAVGRDVIIEGYYSNGVLTANKLLTQCPSKYEPPDPEQVSATRTETAYK